MDNKKIGKFICELRKEKKLTQYDLAEKIPISREAISKWERGINKPDKSCIQALCKIFDVTSDEILLGRKEAKKEDIQALTLDLYEDRNKKQKLVKLSFVGIILILLLFLSYYFIENYNSIHVYTINYSDNNVTITDGIFTTTKEKIYFYLGKVDSDKVIKKVQLYYKDKNNKEKIIYETDDINIMLYDFYGYNDYFNFNDIKYILKNTYLDIEQEDNEYTIKLDFINDFSNSKIINSKKDNVTENKEFEKKIDIEKIKDKFTLINDMYFYQDKNVSISYFEETELINLLLENKNSTEEWNYYISADTLEYSEYNSKETVNSFTIEKDDFKCQIGKCENYKEKENYFFKKINEIY